MKEEEIVESQDKDSFEKLLKDYDEQSKQAIQRGVISKISEQDSCVFIDVGMKSDGRISIDEIKDKQGKLLFKEGDQIDVILTGSNTERPKLSHKAAIKKIKVKEFIDAHDNFDDLVVEGVVKQRSRKSYIVDVDGIEMNMPIAHSAYAQDAQPVGKKITAYVIGVDTKNLSIKISRKLYISRKRKEQKDIINKLLEDKDAIRAVTIKNVRSYGLFVDVDGADGLIHYTEISYKGPINPSNLFSVGQKIEAKILEYDKEKRRLSLSAKAVHPNPWDDIDKQLEVGDTIKGLVTNMEKYGAFIDLGNDIEGFLHISELSWDKDIVHPSDILSLGEEIVVEIIELIPSSQRLRVSLKKLLPRPFDEFAKNHKVGEKIKAQVVSIKDFGCFLRIDGVEGLLHNDEISWGKNDLAQKSYKIGDEIEVAILKIDSAKERLSFSVKKTLKSPLEIFTQDNKIGDIVSGELIDIKEFGIFVRLTEGVDALIRIEDLGNQEVQDLTMGQTIEGVIIAIDKDRNRIRMSLKKLAKQKEKELIEQFNDTEENNAFKDAFNALKK